MCLTLSIDLNLYRRGHYQRALEEAIHTHNNQWPVKWLGKNPLHGGGNFNNMSPEERVRLEEDVFVLGPSTDLSLSSRSSRR